VPVSCHASSIHFGSVALRRGSAKKGGFRAQRAGFSETVTIVTLASDLADVDAVREYFHLDSVILLGHSWGTVLALVQPAHQCGPCCT